MVEAHEHISRLGWRQHLALLRWRWSGWLLRWQWPMGHRLRVSWAVLIRGGYIHQMHLDTAKPPSGMSSPAS